MGWGGGGGGWAGQSDPEIRGGGLKIFFSALRALVWFQNKWGCGMGRVPRAPPLDPPMKTEIFPPVWPTVLNPFKSQW